MYRRQGRRRGRRAVPELPSGPASLSSGPPSARSTGLVAIRLPTGPAARESVERLLNRGTIGSTRLSRVSGDKPLATSQPLSCIPGRSSIGQPLPVVRAPSLPPETSEVSTPGRGPSPVLATSDTVGRVAPPGASVLSPPDPPPTPSGTLSLLQPAAPPPPPPCPVSAAVPRPLAASGTAWVAPGLLVAEGGGGAVVVAASGVPAAVPDAAPMGLTLVPSCQLTAAGSSLSRAGPLQGPSPSSSDENCFPCVGHVGGG